MCTQLLHEQGTRLLYSSSGPPTELRILLQQQVNQIKMLNVLLLNVIISHQN